MTYLGAMQILARRPKSNAGRRKAPICEKLSERASKAWKSARLNRITLHECRHTFGPKLLSCSMRFSPNSGSTGKTNALPPLPSVYWRTGPQ